MSDHKDNDHLDNDRQDNDFDTQISELYQQASRDLPPSHLDDAILAAAKREVGQATLTNVKSKSKVTSPFGGRWTLPVSLAAVIVLSVSVVTLVQKERPSEISSSFMDFDQPTTKRLQPEPESPVLGKAVSEEAEEKVARLKKKVQPDATRTESPSPVPAMRLSKQEAKAPLKEQPSPVAKAKPQAPLRSGLAAKPSAPARVTSGDVEHKTNMLADSNRDLSSSATADETLAHDKTAPSSVEGSIASKEKLHIARNAGTVGSTSSPSTSKAQQKALEARKFAAEPESEEAADQSVLADEATAAETVVAEPIVGEASAPAEVASGTISQRQQLEEKSEQAFSLMPDAAQPQATIQSAKPFNQEPSAAVPTSPQQSMRAFASIAKPANCEALTPLQCMQSPQCTLNFTEENKAAAKGETRLQCRAATNRCEKNFIQYKASKENCEYQTGCRFVPGTCECQPNQPCDCKEGEPAQCVEQ